MARAEHAAVTVSDGDLGVRNLGGRLSAELTYRLDKQEHAAHAGMVGEQATAIGVERGPAWAVPAQPAALRVGSAFPRPQKPRPSSAVRTVIVNES